MMDIHAQAGGYDPRARYIVPSFTEKTSYGVKEMNPYNKMFEDRIIFLGTPINDDVANVVRAFEGDHRGVGEEPLHAQPRPLRAGAGDDAAELAVHDERGGRPERAALQRARRGRRVRRAVALGRPAHAGARRARRAGRALV